MFDVLKQYGIREFFDDVTLSSIVSYRKPHAYIFRIAIEQSGFRPEECAFVGDSDIDMQMANNAGMLAVGVLWGYRDRATLEAAGAKVLVSHPSQLAAAIAGK